MSVFISYHADAAHDITRLRRALHAEGLFCTENEREATTILLYISSAYIAPHSATIAAAGRFLDPSMNSRLTIAIFGLISVPQVKHLSQAPGWDEEGILAKLVSNMGIDMRHRGLDIERVASIVKAQVLRASNSKCSSTTFDIFLSHAGEDKQFIRVLREVLEQQYRCFLDEESLAPGNRMGMTGSEQLVTAARTARLGLFVLSDRSIKKKWPLIEVRIFQEMGTPIVVVWYQFLKEQAEQFVRNPPRDLLQHSGAKEFLERVLSDPRVRSISYPGDAWNNPNKEEYAHHIKRNIQALL